MVKSRTDQLGVACSLGRGCKGAFFAVDDTAAKLQHSQIVDGINVFLDDRISSRSLTGNKNVNIVQMGQDYVQYISRGDHDSHRPYVAPST